MRDDVLKQAQQGMDIDLTPMIDCVFLLMIFFVLIIDLSQKNLEDLILPTARFQQPDEQPAENRPVVNVLQSGAVYYRQEVQYDPAVDGTDYSGIQNMLTLIKKTGGLKMKDETLPDGRVVSVVDEPILVRPDKWTEWHYVGEVMRQCAEAGFRVVELAMSEKDKEEALRKGR